MIRRSPRPQRAIAYWRYLAVIVGLVALPVLALWQTAGLQVLEDVERGARFLQNQGDARTQRALPIPAYRGLITDRRGEPLAEVRRRRRPADAAGRSVARFVAATLL